MCELCDAGYSPDGGGGYLQFPEPITKVYVRETVDKNGCRLEELIVNDKWKLIDDPTSIPPFRYVKIMPQPLNEAYKNEVLEAYQKISDTFDDFTQLMRKRVPYEQWPAHCQAIAGVNPELLGPSSETPPRERGNFPTKDIWDVLRERGLNPMEAFPTAVISRLEDIGRAQARLKSILDDEIFENLSKHNPYWDSKHELEADKLDDLRRKISCLSDNLWDLWTILRKEEE